MKKRLLLVFIACFICVAMIATAAACKSKTAPDITEPDNTLTDTPGTPPAPSTTEPEDNYTYKTVVAEQTTLGCGGYGAVFNACIDPFDDNCYAATCDMGSVYFSFDKGEKWIRHNVQGTTYCLKYDPNTEGVVWVGGSGVYKSTDHGRTLDLVFPKKEQITAEGNNYENANYWIYTDKASDYAPHYQIWSIAINRKSNGKNVFVGQRVPSAGLGYNKCIRIYQTTDGENFSLFTEVEYAYNFKLDYDETNDCLVVVTKDKILEIDQNKQIYTIPQPVRVQFGSGNNICFGSCYDAERDLNTFVFSSEVEQEHVAVACYKTNNLRDISSYADITAELPTLTVEDMGLNNISKQNAGRPSYEYCEWVPRDNGYVAQQFKWAIQDVCVLSDDVIYLFHEANTPTYGSDGKLYITRRTMIYLKYDARAEGKSHYRWVFGFPQKPYNQYIDNVSWQDSDSDYCFGMSSSKNNENCLLYCSNVGVYYTEDGETVTQLNSKMFEPVKLSFHDNQGNTAEKTLKRVVTTGVDVICTQSLVTDPYDSNHLLMGCTDIGLIQSYDNGESWFHSLNAWIDGKLTDITYAQYTNTCFELHFDTERPNVVYSIWTLAKTAPYATGRSYLTGDSRFGVSYDGGLSWTMKKINPEGNCLPYRMQVLYEGDARIIYIATDSHGFFVTRDLGESFTALNDGLDVDTKSVSGMSAIWGNEILVCEMGTFAITGAAATSTDYQNYQMLYQWNESLNKFEKIGIPTSEYNGKTYPTAAIRDIVYDSNNKCLYLACTAVSVNNYSTLTKKAGGIWKYKDGEFTQIYDENISVFGLNIDGSGHLYATELNGRLIRFDDNNTTYSVLLDGLFHRMKGIYFGATDDILYLPTWGGSTERVILKREKISE